MPARSAGNHLLDEDASIDGKTHLFGQIGANGIRLDAQRGPLDTSVAREVGQHRLGRVDGNREADTGALVGAIRGDHGVDTNDLATGVEQRAAGVAGIDGRVGLNGILNGCALGAAGRGQGADGADNAARHGAVEAEGIADGVNLLAHRKSAGIGQRDRLQVGRFDLQQGQIVHLVDAHHFGGVAALIAERHLDAAVGALHHMVVGEHMAGLVEDEARALALLRHRAVKEVEDKSF
jgi:hypothetical protein